MTLSKLELLKAQFAQKTGGGFTNFFPFYKAPEDSTTIFRFLPDADENNPMQFLVENHIHELIINGEKKRVACLKMYGEDCPICKHSAENYAKGRECKNLGDLEGEKKWNAIGKQFYRKLSYIGQGIVVDSPVEHDQNVTVKLIDFGTKIYQQMQSAFQSGDLEKEPYDFFEGYNFRFKKTKGPYGADYTTSSFAPKQTALTEELIEKIELVDLKTQRHRYTPLAEVETLLLAARTGGSIAPVSTPAGTQLEQAAVTSTVKEEPVAETPPAASNSNVLANLRARAKAQAEANAGSED